MRAGCARSTSRSSSTRRRSSTLAEVGFDPEFGARPLRRAIQRELENELSRLVLEGALAPDDRVRVGFRDGKLTFDVEKGAAEIAEELDETLEREAAAKA